MTSKNQRMPGGGGFGESPQRGESNPHIPPKVNKPSFGFVPRGPPESMDLESLAAKYGTGDTSGDRQTRGSRRESDKKREGDPSRLRTPLGPPQLSPYIGYGNFPPSPKFGGGIDRSQRDGDLPNKGLDQPSKDGGDRPEALYRSENPDNERASGDEDSPPPAVAQTVLLEEVATPNSNTFGDSSPAIHTSEASASEIEGLLEPEIKGKEEPETKKPLHPRAERGWKTVTYGSGYRSDPDMKEKSEIAKVISEAKYIPHWENLVNKDEDEPEPDPEPDPPPNTDPPLILGSTSKNPVGLEIPLKPDPTVVTLSESDTNSNQEPVSDQKKEPAEVKLDRGPLAPLVEYDSDESESKRKDSWKGFMGRSYGFTTQPPSVHDEDDNPSPIRLSVVTSDNPWREEIEEDHYDQPSRKDRTYRSHHDHAIDELTKINASSREPVPDSRPMRDVRFNYNNNQSILFGFAGVTSTALRERERSRERARQRRERREYEEWLKQREYHDWLKQRQKEAEPLGSASRAGTGPSVSYAPNRERD